MSGMDLSSGEIENLAFKAAEQGSIKVVYHLLNNNNLNIDIDPNAIVNVIYNTNFDLPKNMIGLDRNEAYACVVANSAEVFARLEDEFLDIAVTTANAMTSRQITYEQYDSLDLILKPIFTYSRGGLENTLFTHPQMNHPTLEHIKTRQYPHQRTGVSFFLRGLFSAGDGYFTNLYTEFSSVMSTRDFFEALQNGAKIAKQRRVHENEGTPIARMDENQP